MHSLSVVSLQLISSHLESSYFDLTVYRKHNSSTPSSQQHTGRPLLCSLSAHTAFCHVLRLGQQAELSYNAPRLAGAQATPTPSQPTQWDVTLGEYGQSLLPGPSETGSDNRSFSSGLGQGCMAGQGSRLLKPCTWQPRAIAHRAAGGRPRGPFWGNRTVVLRKQNYIVGTSAARLLYGWVARLIILTSLGLSARSPRDTWSTTHSKA